MTQPGQKRNYQKELDRLIEGLQREGRIPKLLLHSCCAPCSSYVLEYLSQYFDDSGFQCKNSPLCFGRTYRGIFEYAVFWG